MSALRQLDAEDLPASTILAGCEVPDPAAVEQFLCEHPEIPPMIVEALPKIHEYFGGDSRIKVCLLEDPLTLALLVETSQEPSQALARLFTFYENWWLTESLLARSTTPVDLTIDLESV